MRREIFGPGSTPASPSGFDEAGSKVSYPNTLASGTEAATTSESAAQRWQHDHHLMQRVAAKDQAAEEELVRRVLGRAKTVCRSLLGTRGEHADAAQMAVEAVLRSAPRFRGECSLETWTERIAARTALRMGRKQRFFELFSRQDDEELQALPSAPAETGQEALPRPLQDYLDALPEARREVLALRYRLDYSLVEIAEATGLKVDTVKYRLKQALAQLRALVRRDLALRGRPT